MQSKGTILIFYSIYRLPRVVCIWVYDIFLNVAPRLQSLVRNGGNASLFSTRAHITLEHFFLFLLLLFFLYKYTVLPPLASFHKRLIGSRYNMLYVPTWTIVLFFTWLCESARACVCVCACVLYWFGECVN